jgi:hypothetical protein
MEPARLLRSVRWRAHAASRAARRAIGLPVTREDLSLTSAAGYPIAVRLTRPRSPGPWPGLVVSPAIHQGILELETFENIVTSAELAGLGYLVLTHDPAGRGESWGSEDFGGPEQQDDLRTAVRFLAGHREATSVAVLSLSFGVVAAAALLSRELGVRWLVDWEGPSDRDVVTTGGTRLTPADGHALDDEEYWTPREALRHIPRLRCGYVRLQAAPDHAQGQDLRHARRMLRAASTAAWHQLNDHPRGEHPTSPRWLAAGPAAANAAILEKLLELR